MASSSVSQESLDRDDYDMVCRRGGAHRMRAVRGRSFAALPPPRNDSVVPADMEASDVLGHTGLPDVGELGEHDSPTRTASRLKDKRGRPIHLHKGKTAKDKRKLREKRRSTGVVHLASTESTGDSLDEDEKLVEARRNTTYNEVIDADNPQTPEEDRKGYGTRTRNKSPSDLEADLEDNQDYDSTVSQSETNLTMIGRGTVVPQYAPSSKMRMRPPLADVSSSLTTTPAGTDPESCKEEPELEMQLAAKSTPRPMSYPSCISEQDLDKFTTKQQESMGGPGSVLKSSLSSRSSNNSETSRAIDHVRWRDRSHDTERAQQLEKALTLERIENQRLREKLAERDALISDLRREVALLHKDLEVADEEFDGVKKENQALLRALASLAVDV